MLGILKSLFGRPRRATTVMVWLSYRDRGREGMEAIVELHGANAEGFPWTWDRASVRSPGGSVTAGTIDLQEGWVDRLSAHGFAPGTRDGEPIVVAKEGLGSWASGSLLAQHPGTILLTLPDEVFERIAKLGSMVQEATLVEPKAAFTIRLEDAAPVGREDHSDDAVHVSADPEPFSLTEEESAAVGRLVGLGYVLGTEREAHADERERERRGEETAASDIPPPTGMWASLPPADADQVASGSNAAPAEGHHAPVSADADPTPSEAPAADWTPSDGGYAR